MRDHEARERALRTMLDEKLGGRMPPDLSKQILRRVAESQDGATTPDGDATVNYESFETVAAGSNRGLLGEFCGFMSENAKWWLTPFLIVFGLLGVLLILGATGAAPFIYTLF